MPRKRPSDLISRAKAAGTPTLDALIRRLPEADEIHELRRQLQAGELDHTANSLAEFLRRDIEALALFNRNTLGDWLRRKL